MNISVSEASSVREGRQPLDALLDDERPHLAQAREPALDVARAPRLEVAHGELEQLPGQEVERVAVDHDRGLAQDVTLDEGRARDRDENRRHAAEQEVEQVVVVVDEDVVEDHLREDRQHHLQRRREQGQDPRPDERALERPEEVPDPVHVRVADGRLLEALSVGEQGRVAGPFLHELLAIHLHEPASGVRKVDVLVLHPVEDDPVVAVEVADGRKRQLIEPGLRRLHGADAETDLLGPVRNPGEARAVDRGVDEPANVREADRPPEMPGHHREARGAAVHLVHLPHVREALDPLRPLALLGSPLLDRLLGGGRRIDLVEADRLGNRRLGRDELLREIERDPGHELELVALNLTFDDARNPASDSTSRRKSGSWRTSSFTGVTASMLTARGAPRSSERSPKKSPRRMYATSPRAPSSVCQTARKRPSSTKNIEVEASPWRTTISPRSTVRGSRASMSESSVSGSMSANADEMRKRSRRWMRLIRRSKCSLISGLT